MKKVLSYILILLIISVNLLAPFSVEAAIDATTQPTQDQVAIDFFNLNLKAEVFATNTTARVEIILPKESEVQTASFGGVIYNLYLIVSIVDTDGNQIKTIPENPIKQGFDKNWGADQTAIKAREAGNPILFNFSKLDSSTNYKAKIELQKATFIPGSGTDYSPITDKTVDLKTNDANNQEVISQGETEIKVEDKNSLSTMPACIFGSPLKGTISGCIAQALYYMLYVPTSYLFALAGLFFDSTFAYSVNDTSYRSSFVVQGWGLVRDFCNMFFIFIMLYIAIGTILSLHSMKTKETIINVVIIGLFINFSLFAAQVIIDASNITARVFYNSNAIKITKDGVDGASTAFTDVGAGGVIPLSSAIVNKVNPQNIIINAGKINEGTGQISSTDKAKLSQYDSSEQKTLAQKQGEGDPNFDSGAAGFTAGTFILIVLMTTAVNVVGFIVFFSVGLIFISRVIGLWLAMILAPLAFFTYILPEMASVKMIGWKNWWQDTLKMAFLAPVFMFFLYIILKFLETGLIGDTQNKEGLAFFVATLIPFAFVMILMWKAKNIASDMSGEFGKQVTGAVTAGGGMLLGGAALGTAFLGRKVIGGTLTRAANGETNTQAYADAIRLKRRGDTSAWDKLNWRQKATGWAGTKSGLNAVYGKVARDPDGNKVVAGGLGKLLNKSQNKTNEVEKARHASDEDMKKAGFEGLKWSQLSNEQRNIVKDKVKLENNAKFADEAERDYRRANGLSNVDPATGKLRDLTPEQKEAVKNLAKSKAVDKFEANITKAAEGVNAFTRVMAGANTSSYDVRKLSDISANKNASLFTKMSAGLISSSVTGMRSGLLKSAGLSNGGVKVEGKFLNDLKSVIGDSLKNMKVTLPKSEGGEHHEEVKVGHGH